MLVVLAEFCLGDRVCPQLMPGRQKVQATPLLVSQVSVADLADAGSKQSVELLESWTPCAPGGPRQGVRRAPTINFRRSIKTHICDLYTIAGGVIFTIPGTSATLIRRHSDLRIGALDSGRLKNMRFYSEKCFRTHPGSAIGTQSPGFPDFFLFLLSHYLLASALIVTAYGL